MRCRVLVAVVVALALAGASCGGDDKDDAAGKVQAGNSTTTEARSTGDGNGGGGSATGTPSIFSSAECLKAVQAMASAASSASFALGGKTDQIDATAKEFAAFAKKAPADIRDDINTLSDAYAAYGKIVAESGWNPASGSPPPQSVIDGLAEASKSLESAKVADAQRRLAAWFQNECGR